MKNRINPGPPPSQRPDRRSHRDEGKNPFDLVARVSLPMKALLAQTRKLTDEADKGATVDLLPIWRAARTDPGLEDRNPITPPRYVDEHYESVTAIDDSDEARYLVDSNTALSYTQAVDPRVALAVREEFAGRVKQTVADDPVQAGVDACKGGPFGLMFVALHALTATKQAPEDYFEALMTRAREQAADLDPIAAESLVEQARSAIEGCPDLRKVAARGFDPETD